MQNLVTKNPKLKNPVTQNTQTINKRIRSTSYIVNVHFSTTSKETICDKILRLIKNDMAMK